MAALVCITWVKPTNTKTSEWAGRTSKKSKGGDTIHSVDYRYDLPFVFTDALEADNDPLDFPLVVGRGFLLELATSEAGRGAASFITIFA